MSRKTFDLTGYPWLRGAVLALGAMLATITLAQTVIHQPTQTQPTAPTCNLYDKDGKYDPNSDCAKQYNRYQQDQLTSQSSYQTAKTSADGKTLGIAALVAIVLAVLNYFLVEKSKLFIALTVGGIGGFIGLLLMQLPGYTPNIRASALGLLILGIYIIGWMWLDSDLVRLKERA